MAVNVKNNYLKLIYRRENVVTILKTLSNHGKEITDSDMISWANEAVKVAGNY